ncbi:MAG: hypothetical protein ACM3UT_03335 [Chloroflexota bacterium]
MAFVTADLYDRMITPNDPDPGDNFDIDPEREIDPERCRDVACNVSTSTGHDFVIITNPCT